MKANNWYLILPIATIITVIGLGAVTRGLRGALESTPQEVFDGMRQSFQANKAKGVHARYQWELSGPQWRRMVDRRERRDLQDGKRKNRQSKCHVRNQDKDWVAISNGKLGGTWAYLTGRLKIRGDQGVARKLGEMFP